MEEINLSEAGLISAQRAAQILGTSRDYVWHLGHYGHLKVYRIGASALYLEEEVRAYLASHPRIGLRYSRR